jgi:hypothetical protein
MRERPGAGSSSPCGSGWFPLEGEPSRREGGGEQEGWEESETLRPGRRRSVRISPHGMMRHLEKISDNPIHAWFGPEPHAARKKFTFPHKFPESSFFLPQF